jgi:hypothetical protein
VGEVLHRQVRAVHASEASVGAAYGLILNSRQQLGLHKMMQTMDNVGQALC